MSRIGTNLRRPLVWGMMLLAVVAVLSPAVLRADRCLDAFVRCITDVRAYLIDPLHALDCFHGAVFCYVYVPR